jgi:AcrR family transcriptional regulator
MPAKTDRKIPDSNTETKIKAAARSVFHKKGFAGTRTRDIAKEANLNLALLNYYFKSKQKLFELIMLETLKEFNQAMGEVLNNEITTLEKKIHLISEKYIDLIMAEPEMPIFIMAEIRSNGAAILEKLPANGVLQSAFIKQYRQAVNNKIIVEPNPLHFLMNLTGLITFPFINAPILKKVGNLSDMQFDKLMKERKKKIPIWIKAMFRAT